MPTISCVVGHDESMSTQRRQKRATPAPTTTPQPSEQGAGSDPVSRRTRWIVEAAVVVVAAAFRRVGAAPITADRQHAAGGG